MNMHADIHTQAHKYARTDIKNNNVYIGFRMHICIQYFGRNFIVHKLHVARLDHFCM